MTEAELADLDPSVQALAMLTGLSFTTELMLTVMMSNLPADQARTMAGVMLNEWRAHAMAANAAAGERTQVIGAAGLCVERLLASAFARAENIRTIRAANAAAAAMATCPTTGTVN